MAAWNRKKNILFVNGRRNSLLFTQLNSMAPLAIQH